MGHELFLALRLNGKPLHECELALECNLGNYRLYIDRIENGFYAMAVEFCSAGTALPSVWDCDDLEVDQLFKVTAYSDGIRHLEFNREDGDMAGYIYYPSTKDLILLFQKLRELELEMCLDADQ